MFNLLFNSNLDSYQESSIYPLPMYDTSIFCSFGSLTMFYAVFPETFVVSCVVDQPTISIDLFVHILSFLYISMPTYQPHKILNLRAFIFLSILLMSVRIYLFLELQIWIQKNSFVVNKFLKLKRL